MLHLLRYRKSEHTLITLLTSTDVPIQHRNGEIALPKHTITNMPLSILESLAKDLWKEQSRDDTPDPERCREILQAALSSLSSSRWEDSSSATTTLWKKTMDACKKTFRRQKRQSAISEDQLKWSGLLELVASLATALESKGESPLQTEEEEEDSRKPNSRTGELSSLPTSVSQYLTRLQQQKKEIYKNPPVLPPVAVTVDEHKAPLPKRDARTRRLTFAAAAATAGSSSNRSSSMASLLRDFHPNVTPEEVLRCGAFGGTYFRSIHSAVTNRPYQAADVLGTTVEPSWIQGLDSKRLLTSSTYNPAVNKFKVKCGGSLGMWEVRRFE